MYGLQWGPWGPHSLGTKIWIPKNSSSSSTVPRGPQGTKSPLSYVEIENFCAQKHLAKELYI